MKNSIKLFATGILGLVSITACDLEGKNYIQFIESSVTQNVLVNNIASKADASSLKFNLNGYKVEKGANSCSVDLFGKLVDETGYAAFTTLSYNDVSSTEFSKKNSSKSSLLKSLANVVSKNYNYKIENNQVDDFVRVNDVVKNLVPQKDSAGHDLGSVEAYSISNFNYDGKSEKASFKTNIKAVYQWKATSFIYTDAGLIPYEVDYHDDKILSYNINYNLSIEEYQSHKDDTKYMFDVFEKYVENEEKDKYSFNEIDADITLRKILSHDEDLSL